MNLLLLFLRMILAAVFGIAGIAKLFDLPGSRKSLTNFGVPAFLAGPLGMILPLAEVSCAVALIPVTSARWGAIGIMFLVLIFIVGISSSLARGARPDCHCFGQLHSEPISWKTLARNGVLLAMASAVVLVAPDTERLSVFDWLGGMDHFGMAVLVFSIVAAVMAAFMSWTTIHLLRQNGRLMMRIEALEAKVGSATDQQPPPPGLPVNSAAPDFSLSRLEGGKVALSTLSVAGRPLVLIFTEPNCESCELLLPEVSQWQREHSERLTIVPISRGSAEANRSKSLKYGIKNLLLQTDSEAIAAYHVEATPSAVLVMGGQIGSPLATGADEIRSMVSRATLPPPVGRGDSSPSLILPDLKGETLDIATLRGHRTLLLFWNPSCGFCQQMLDDLKAWERNPPKDAPQLLVISAGSTESNQEQGFRARVLLDQTFGSGQVFGAGGTPAAVIIDEQGKVASDVGVGSDAVLALAGAISIKK